jgi:methylmalonyl-CoA carboxyltransferase large subunit
VRIPFSGPPLRCRPPGTAQHAMSSNTPEQEALLQAIESLRGEVARLSSRVAALEGSNHESVARFALPPKKKEADVATATDETLITVISAAIAAYLGVQPRIRQIRLVGGTSWAQQGRVTIQASHAIPVRHG